MDLGGGTDGVGKAEGKNQYASVWMSIVQERLEVEHMGDDKPQKLMCLRNHAIFLERHDAISRSDDETKYDTRREADFRVHCEGGILQTDPLMSRRLDMCLAGKGGAIYRNYRHPKDPRKTGDTSDSVMTQPLRLEKLVNPKCPWLADAKTVGFLCSVRVKRDFYRCMEKQGLVDKVPAGKTWTALKTQRVDGMLGPLLPSTVATLVKKRASLGGLKVHSGEEPGRSTDNSDTLAGHFLRGHAGSVAYSLAVEYGAGWDPLLGIDRARHTLTSFQKHYQRGVHPRLSAAFTSHKYQNELRFEEAARL